MQNTGSEWGTRELALRLTENMIDKFYELKSINENQKLNIKREVDKTFGAGLPYDGHKAAVVAAYAVKTAFDNLRDSQKIPRYVGKFEDVNSVMLLATGKKTSRESVLKFSAACKEYQDAYTSVC